jgi:hypothetical protein
MPNKPMINEQKLCWTKPELIVITRNVSGREYILIECKGNNTITTPDGAYDGCCIDESLTCTAIASS